METDEEFLERTSAILVQAKEAGDADAIMMVAMDSMHRALTGILAALKKIDARVVALEVKVGNGAA